MYPCPAPAPARAQASAPQAQLGDCPMHENVRWRFNGHSLQSFVLGHAPSPGNITWDLCLTLVDKTGEFISELTLEPCTIPRSSQQQWQKTAVGASGLFQLCLMQGTAPKCLSTQAPSLLKRDPIVNLFEDTSSAQIVVITSPGALANGTFEDTLHDMPQVSSLCATTVRPGEARPTRLMGIRQDGGNITFTADLLRGAAAVRIELSDCASFGTVWIYVPIFHDT
jgi:hypothetical protein